MKPFLKILPAVILGAGILVLAWPESPAERPAGAAIVQLGSHAGFQNGEFVPYPGARNVTTRHLKLNGVPVKILSFDTKLDLAQVARYYLDSLKRAGWRDLTADMIGFMRTMDPSLNRSGPAFPAGTDFHFLFSGDKTGNLIFQRDGRNNQTRCLIMLTEASKGTLLRMAAANAYGDAPGKDPEDLPRYPSSRRTLNLQEETAGLQGTLSTYQSRGTLAGQQRFFEREMKAAGWELERTVSDENEDGPLKVMNFTKGSRSCLVAVQGRRRNAGTETLTVYKERK